MRHPSDPSSSAPDRSRRALVFAHFDPHGGFDPHVVEALRRYRPHADRLVVVSASAVRLPATLRGLVDTFVPRANVGYDFGSWQAGLATLCPADFDEILCVNDSVYGPLFDLAPALCDPRTAGADLWGMVLSEQSTRRRGGRCPHIQSWFFGMRRRLLDSPVYEAFWNGIVPLADKQAIVDRYELGLSVACRQAGLKIAAIYDARTAGPMRLGDLWPHLSLTDPRRSWRLWKKGRRTPHNPSELAWLRLLEAGVPFVKVGLFRVNHYGLDLGGVTAALGRRHPDALPLIRGHLDRCG
jgi:lipopolysaccharide biosynthesis protein